MSSAINSGSRRLLRRGREGTKLSFLALQIKTVHGLSRSFRAGLLQKQSGNFLSPGAGRVQASRTRVLWVCREPDESRILKVMPRVLIAEDRKSVRTAVNALIEFGETSRPKA